MTPPPVVCIVWEDACCLDPGDRWVDHTEHKYVPLIVTTIGFLLHSDERGVIVTSAWSPDCIGPRDQIPKGMIRRITRLKVGGK